MSFFLVLLVLVTVENKVNSYSEQLKLGWVCKFKVEFDKNLKIGSYEVKVCLLDNLT